MSNLPVVYLVYLSLEISIQLFFLFLFSSYRFFLSLCCLCRFLLLWSVFICPFLCSLRVVVSLHQRHLQCSRILFLFLFLPHIICLCHFSDLRPYALLWVFLFSGPFVKVLSSSTSKMVLSILRGRQPMYLALWWYFCSLVSSSFLVLLRYTFFKCFLSSPLVWWCPLLISPSISKFPFLRAFWFFLDLVMLQIF